MSDGGPNRENRAALVGIMIRGDVCC
jgi:hypothetical protein